MSIHSIETKYVPKHIARFLNTINKDGQISWREYKLNKSKFLQSKTWSFLEQALPQKDLKSMDAHSPSLSECAEKKMNYHSTNVSMGILLNNS